MIVDAAVRNNAEWCAQVCREHGLASTFTDRAWTCSSRAPKYYPDAVTLTRAAVPPDFLPLIDATVGCGVKDSYAVLDLEPYGFEELFSAQWIHRPADLPVPAGAMGEMTADLTLAAGVVGVTNVGAPGERPLVLTVAAQRFPGVPVVGYERGDDLAGALDHGFTAIGPLRVWVASRQGRIAST